MHMTRIVFVAVSSALVTLLGLTRSATGQARQLMQPPSARVDGEKKPGTEKKNEPGWRTVMGYDGEDNRTYLARLTRIRDELEQFRSDRFWGDALKQQLGTEYSYVGRYQQALECFDGKSGPQKKAGQLMSAERYEPLDAVATILELADKHRVIMINEAHHVPMHRAFTLQLLDGLYQKGFRYFAAETLSSGDESLETRGYPTLRTGYYTVEPVYSDLVRTALKLGYHLTPYECEDSPPHNVANPIPAMNVREQGQARNLKERILDKDPGAKIIVHAGYAHICKVLQDRKQGGLKCMALAFHELTGIEPFSIDQTEMSEMNKPDNEKADYRFAVEKGLVKERPVVLRDTEKDVYLVCTANVLMYDLSVVHPRCRYENGRPTWLAMGSRRAPYAVKTEARPRDGKSFLAQAFFTEELSPEAVPIDQMAYSSEEPLPTLWLPAGKFQIRIVDENAKIVDEYPLSER
jgi:hypothetical protein